MTCGEKFRTKPLTKVINSCKPIIDRDLFVGGSCPIRRGVGNPIEPRTGLKQQLEDIFGWGRGHALRMNYLSLLMPESGTIILPSRKRGERRRRVATLTAQLAQ